MNANGSERKFLCFGAQLSDIAPRGIRLQESVIDDRRNSMGVNEYLFERHDSECGGTRAEWEGTPSLLKDITQAESSQLTG